MLHPNSASRFVFKKQMEDTALTCKFRLIALDLPGHGESKRAKNPKDTYTFPGYAKAIASAVKELAIQKCALLGWSLGGHVALEAMDQIPGVWAVALSGTPPIEVSPKGFQAAFNIPSPEMMKLMTKAQFTEEEASTFAVPIGGESWMADHAKIADGMTRKRLGESILECIGRDERELVATMPFPLAIIGGESDPVVNKEYMKTISFNNLWGMHRIAEGGHGVIYEQSKMFNEIFLRFLVEKLPV
jgi:pimeloyl-ACP methyl ester carboxylesterase